MSLLDVTSRLLRRYLPPGSGVLFSRATRRRIVLVFLGSLVLAAFELAGMGTLLLLMQQFAGTSATPSLLTTVSRGLGLHGPNAVLVLLAGAVLTIFVAKAAIGLVFRRWVIAFMQRAQAETSVRLLARYLNGPYLRLLGRNSADLVRTMYDGTASVYGQVVGSMVQTAVEVATILAVLGFLVAAMPIPTLAALAFFAVTVFVLNAVVRRRASAAGEVMVTAGTRAYRSMLQALAGAKEIKVRRTQGQFIEEFASARLASARAGAAVGFLGEAPRFVLEVLFIVAILLVSGLVSLTAEPGQTLPLIAIFVAAGVRLLPSASRVVAMSSAVRAGVPQMRTVIADLTDGPDAEEVPGGAEDSSRLPLRERLVIDDVHFRYPSSETDVLRGISLDVEAGRSLAVVGQSGAGKSTFVDLLLGLHQPTSGEVRADGVAIREDVAAWQRGIGLVPQDVFLLDDTVRRNVTLGLPDGGDDDRVLRALSLAQLDEFLAELPEGLDTRLGERGSRVSGGQRQRIGIARALFVDPGLLVLDEATSALDNDAENRISATIRSLQGVVTTVVVAHRLSTVRHCDTIVFLEGGRVAAQGSFEEVVRASAAFAHLVELGRL
ncbi:ABC transporter ATP-binding protein [Oryzobacter telluris]|uniref:ABC transporter ATP-binding protein n=1 Tax=Oryzobacter telluris TaxID=3149179 RepID=UPI00370DC5DE